MADVLFIEYPKCSTCKKAKAWLDAHGVAYADAYALLAENGMMVKRPLVVGDDFVLVGFKEVEWERALL